MIYQKYDCTAVLKFLSSKVTDEKLKLKDVHTWKKSK